MGGSVRRALISVSDKTGVPELGRALTAREWMIISTGGTKEALAVAKVPVVKIESITGVPEMLGGRVKTIHPKIAGGILARRDNPQDMKQLEEKLNMGAIDLVVVNLYPFLQTAAKPDAGYDDLIENIDIGGPTLLRAAAKNSRDVVVLVDPLDYPRFLFESDLPGGVRLEFRFEMMRKAFEHTAAYDAAIAQTMAEFVPVNGKLVRQPKMN
ncbi:MAG: IMP cyclohydrolase [Candidatus Doudnabacteria bacterium]